MEGAQAGEKAYKEYLNSGKKSYSADEVLKCKADLKDFERVESLKGK